jgi:hypothetical protein
MRTPLFTLLVPLLVLWPTPAAATPTVPSDLRLSTPWSVGPKLDKYESWPDAVTAANGWVVMAHSSGDRHVPLVDRRTVVRVSKDKGVTWQLARVFHSTNMSGFEGIHRLPSGRILIMLSDLNGHDDFNWVQTWKSDDNGLTWQALSKRYAWTDPWSFGNLERVTCDGGKLMIMWNNDVAWGSATSRDGGVTWTRASHTAQHQMFEGRLTQVSGDRLLAIGRSDQGPILFKSPDCGKTWTSAATGIGGRLSEGAVRHGDIWRMVTINRTNYRMEVRDASLTELWNSPTAWSAPRLLRTLQPAGPVDLGYPVILSVSRSYDLVVWYGPTKIVKRPMIYAAHLPWRVP